MDTNSLYAVGDVHGCYDTLLELIDKLRPDFPVIFMGDLVNRGPKSLEVLRFVKGFPRRAGVLLGNHDLHLLALAAGAGRNDPRDTLAPILEAPDAGELIDFLRHQKLLISWKNFTFVHAGIDPAWDLKKAKALAREAEACLSGPGWKYWLSDMYGKDLWKDSLTGIPRLRAILNGFTRIRFVRPDGTPDYKAKLSPSKTGGGLVPWFASPQRKTRDTTVVCGHWSTLGLRLEKDFIGIDTGCLWGGALTAIELPSREVVSVRSPGYQDPLRFS